MVERQLNDVELRHDLERVRVASLTVCSSGRLVALSLCCLTVLLIILLSLSSVCTVIGSVALVS